MFKRLFMSTTILILLALSSLGCAGGDRTSRVSTPAVDVTGTWEGSISFTTGADRTVRWVLQQNGANVKGEAHGTSGTASFEGLVNGESLDWTVTGRFIKFGSGDPVSQTFRGEATVNADQLSGRASGQWCPCNVVMRRVNTDAIREKKQ
jgi:hypothetical protein